MLLLLLCGRDEWQQRSVSRWTGAASGCTAIRFEQITAAADWTGFGDQQRRLAAIAAAVAAAVAIALLLQLLQQLRM
jgi:hypothetical protein